jgi:hypothetical protein
MIKIGTRQNCKAALLLRRLSTGNDQARPRTALDSRLAVRSPPHDAGSAHRDRPTGFVTPSTASQKSVQSNTATHRWRRNPHSV